MTDDFDLGLTKSDQKKVKDAIEDTLGKDLKLKDMPF